MLLAAVSSVVLGLVLGRWDVAELAVESAVVELVWVVASRTRS